MASNLPPGCSPSDIPGNRPEDEAWEQVFDAITRDADERGMTPADVMTAWRMGVAAWQTVAWDLEKLRCVTEDLAHGVLRRVETEDE